MRALSLRAAPTATARRSTRLQRLGDQAVTWAITAVAFSGIAAVLLIFVFVAREAVPLFWGPEMSLGETLSKLFLPQVTRPGRPAAFVWQPVSEVPKLSIVPLVVGTLKVSAIGLLLAAPLGVSAALFCSELAPRKLRAWLKPTIELLAGVPSVVVGFFALVVLATVLQRGLGLPSRLNALLAGLAIAIAIVPVIFTVADDALSAVPHSYREASLALGATRWETAWRVVLPAAAPGVLAACMLALGRAIGETMIVLMASGNAAIVSSSPLDSARTLAATIAAELGEVVSGGVHWGALFFLGVVLFALTFTINLATAAWVRRTLKRLHGAPR